MLLLWQNNSWVHLTHGLIQNVYFYENNSFCICMSVKHILSFQFVENLIMIYFLISLIRGQLPKMAHIQSVLPLLVLLSVRAVESQGNSICQTMQYRALSPMLQKEHQCMILERMQQGFDQERQLQNDRFETLFK